MADIVKRGEQQVVKAVAGKLGVKAVGSIAGKVVATVNPLETLETLLAFYTDYKKIAAQEQTKRTEIEAWREVELTKLNAQREVLMTYLDRTFDERKANFKKFFDVLDHAVETEQVDVMAKTLEAITELAKSSPFKEIQTIQQVRGVLDDPDKKFTL